MEGYTNNNNRFYPKLAQMNETVVHSNKMYATNQFGQLCYVTTGQKHPQAGLPNSAIRTAVSQPNPHLHIPDNITYACSSSPTTLHNTAEVYANHIFTPTSHDNQPSPKPNARHTNTPPEDISMAETRPKSFQRSTNNDNNTIYQRQHLQSQRSDQISTVLTENNPILSTSDHPLQNSHPAISTTVTSTITTSVASATVSDTKPIAPMLSHQQDKAYYHCDICLKPFAQRHYLDIHKRSHTGEKPSQCDFCIQKCAPSDHLLQNSHPAISTTVTSTITTSLASATVSDTKPIAPMISHQQGKAYYHCDICLKPFAQRHYLAIHKRSHTGEKPFQCDFCIQKFARRDTLQIHRRIHTGEKPFHCEVCSKQFAQRDKLQIHRRTHSRKKQFHCDICLKQFAQRDYVEIHKRSHTGEKPFECDFCMLKFVRKNTLDIHRRMHTGERPYHCEICGEMFAQTDKLRRHKKSAHGVNGGVSSTGGGNETEVITKSPESDPSTSNPGPVPISNMVALAAASSEITADYPTMNQLWLL